MTQIKTTSEMISEIEKAKSFGVKYITYGDGDLGQAVEIDEAIADISSMEDHQIGEGTWFVCDKNGNVE